MYYPQTDSQTECMNQILKIFLRYYVNEKMDNWIELLLKVEIVLANKKLAATKQCPQKKINNNIIINTRNPNNEATIKAHKIKALQRIKNLEVGDKAYLLTQNFQTIRPSKKLDHKKIGPFMIIVKLGPAIRKLQLPRDAKIYLIFNIFLLHPASPDTPLQSIFQYEPEEENEFEVERILDKNTSQYLVKWKRYNNSENTWEQKKDLINYKKRIRQYK